MNKKWFTQTEYARQHGISREAVRQAILTGRLRSNGKKGRECRVTGEVMESVTQKLTPKAVPFDPEQLNMQILEKKLEKLQADAVLQNQKILTIIEERRIEYIKTVLQVYLEAFLPLKKELSSLKLSEEQTQKLANLVERCTNNFHKKIQEILNEG